MKLMRLALVASLTVLAGALLWAYAGFGPGWVIDQYGNCLGRCRNICIVQTEDGGDGGWICFGWSPC